MQKTPTCPLLDSLDKARKKNKRSGVRLIPDNSNPLSLCWLLSFSPAGPFSAIPYPALSRQSWLLPTALPKLPWPLASGWVKLLEGTLQDYCKKEIREHQERKAIVVTVPTSFSWSYPWVGVTNSSQFSQNFPSFSTESPTSQDSPFQANQDSYRIHWPPLPSFQL